MQSVMDNYKNILQEMCQKNGYGLPTYNLESDGGLPNSPSFEVSVTVEWNGVVLVERAAAVGKKKKEVEKMAAKKMVERLSSGIITVRMLYSKACPSIINLIISSIICVKYPQIMVLCYCG